MGDLATVGFIISEDNIEGFRPIDTQIDFNIEIGTPYSIDQDGQYYEYEGTSITLPVSIGQTTSVETLPPSTIDVFPNPAREQITLQLHNTTNTINDIVLYNLAGAAVYEAKDLHAATYEVPVADLAEGLYIAHLVTDDGVLSKKFEIVR